MAKLSELKPGAKARITSIGLSTGSRQRLLEMGLTSGVAFEVIRFAPLGDPLEIKLRGYHLSLRKIDAEGIEVESVNPHRTP